MSSGPMSTSEGDRGGFSKLLIVAILVAVTGVVILCVFGFRYLKEKDEVAEITAERDVVTKAASEIVHDVFSFHYEDVDASLEKLKENSTGQFLSEQRQFSDEVRERVEEQKAVVTATISNTAISELHVDDGTARVMVVFTATSEREGEEDIIRRQSSVVDLVREDDRWKAAEVNQVGVSVPVGTSSEAVQEFGDALEDEDDATGGDASTEGSEDSEGGEGP